MKFAWIAAAGLLAFGAPAMAQDAPPPQPAAAAPDQGPVDPERLALAHEMIEVVDIKSMLHGMFANMASSFKLPASATADQQERVRQLMMSMGVGFDATQPELLDRIAELYARNFTAQEMRDTLAFYRSASGQSVLKKMPQMMSQVVPLAFGVMPKVVAAAEADYCAHRTCDATDHKVFEVMTAVYASRAPH